MEQDGTHYIGQRLPSWPAGFSLEQYFEGDTRVPTYLVQTPQKHVFLPCMQCLVASMIATREVPYFPS